MVGDFFGSPLDFEYPIGDKLYELAVMNLEDVNKLKKLYTDLIELVAMIYWHFYLFHHYLSVNIFHLH